MSPTCKPAPSYALKVIPSSPSSTSNYLQSVFPRQAPKALPMSRHSHLLARVLKSAWKTPPHFSGSFPFILPCSPGKHSVFP